MSPSESDLRAALRDGEDDGIPDVDGLIAHVRGRRAQRRVRLLSGAAAVVVVAAAAVGGAVVWGGSNGGQRESNSPASSRPTAAHTIAPTAPSSDATSAPAAVSVTCADSAPRPIDPPGRIPSTSSSAMFTAPVQTLVVCSYTDGAALKQVTLTGSAAQGVVASIEAASPRRVQIMCPAIAAEQKTVLALIPVTADGTTLPTLVTDISIPDCNEPITNGGAVRYNWRPPTSLKAQLAGVR